MTCKEPDCGGQVDESNPVGLRVGCVVSKPAYPCEICGRLHWVDGSPVFNRPGDRAFLHGNTVVHKDKKDRIIAMY